MIQLADPVTREPLPALAGADVERARSYAETHWRTGWRSGFNYENGVPTSMWFAMCRDECCAEYRATLPSLEELRK